MPRIAGEVAGMADFGFWHRLGRRTGVRDDAGALDFETLRRRKSPNDALICPAGYCPAAPADAQAPVFPTTVNELAGRLRRVALSEPYTLEIVESKAVDGQLRFVQRSRLLQYPDIIDARCMPTDGGATLSMYSRSLVGRSDLGVNLRRLKRWVAAISSP